MIDVVDEFKYLGVNFDKKVTMRNHFEQLRIKTQRACSAINNLGKSLEDSTPKKSKIDVEKIRATEHKSLTSAIGVDKGCSRLEALTLSDCIPTQKRWALRALKFFVGM
ncbi:hypothetical protein MHBO_001508 [Bonamia ostreae]|uniref:Uncharacterized protein n=1 Tax=Bonamia ostreae TaxID=126728 RepID=A0ABV2AJ67_9EUKA